MSSYKPVIYIFAILGALVFVGLAGTSVKGFMALSNQMHQPGFYMGDVEPYGDEDFMHNTSSFMMNSRSSSSTMDMNIDMPMDHGMIDRGTNQTQDGAMAPSDDSYLGSSVMYSTLRDKNVMNELKLPDTLDPDFRALLMRPDTSFRELYHSDTRLVLAMTALNEEKQSIIVQDLSNGSIYDTGINARANFQLIPEKGLIVFVTPGTGATDKEDELTQANVYDINANKTTREAPLKNGQTFTKKDETFGPVAQMTLKNGKVSVNVYSSQTAARFDADRKVIGTQNYPSAQ